jgi:protein SCO1/2
MGRTLYVVMLSALIVAGCVTHADGQVLGPAREHAATMADVEQRWGIRILGIRLSASGYMLDFRYHVTDAAKAAPLFTRGLQPMLEDELSGARFVVPAPPKTGPLRSTNPPRAGRTYFMFFANPARYVAAGRPVTVTIGDFRVQHLPVMAESAAFPEVPRFDSKSVTVRHADEPRPDDGVRPIVARAGDEITMGRARPTEITVPDVTMTDQSGSPVRLPELVAGDEPVVLTFMFTSCTTNCSTMAATLAQLQRDLGPDAARMRFVSISIDPEHDSPERLRAFLAQKGAQPGWRFLTGTVEQSDLVQRAFGVNLYPGNRETHRPSYFIRDGKSGHWWRIAGLPPASVIAGEVRRLAAPEK